MNNVIRKGIVVWGKYTRPLIKYTNTAEKYTARFSQAFDTAIFTSSNMPYSLRCLIFDYRPEIINALTGFLSERTDMELVKTVRKPKDAMRLLKSQRIHVVFIGEQSEKECSEEIIDSLRQIDALIRLDFNGEATKEDLQTIAHLYTPITKEHFSHVANLLHEYFRQLDVSKHSLRNLSFSDDHFFIRSDSQYVKIRYADVFYLEGMKDFVRIYTDKRQYVVLVNLKNAEAQMPSGIFIRCHRSYLVHSHKIESISSDEVHLGKYTVPLGVAYRDNLLKKVVNHRMLTR